MVGYIYRHQRTTKRIFLQETNILFEANIITSISALNRIIVVPLVTD